MREMTRELLLYQVMETLEQVLPHRTQPLGRDALWSTVQHAIVRARQFGLGDEQLTGYAAAELVFGAEFYHDARYSWAAEILQDHSLRAADKLQKLRETAIFRLAAEAEQAEWAQEQARREAALPPPEPEPEETMTEEQERELDAGA